MSQKVCSQCQTVNQASAQFCGGCGTRMTPAEPQAPQYQAPQAPQHMGATQQAVYQSFGAPAGMLVPAGFGIRFLAFLIDAILLSIPGWFVNLGYLTNAIQIAYYIAMWGTRGQTVGEMVLGLRVVTVTGEPMSFGKAALRFVGYMVSGLTLGIGFLMIAFDGQQHRGLHDRIAGTLMVKKA